MSEFCLIAPAVTANEIAPQTSSATHTRAMQTSERWLDRLTFFLADVADGLGPFLIIDLTSRRGWTSADAGSAMAMLLLGTVFSQTLTGAWIDQTHRKRLAIAMAASVVALASLGLYQVSSYGLILTLQVLTGVAVTVFPPAIAAVSLGLVGRSRLPARAGRNEACFHAGNVVSAGIAVVANRIFGSPGVFYVVAGMATLAAICAWQIREEDIDHQLARGADNQDGGVTVMPIRQLLTDPRIIWFSICVVMFHFANAAMLPLVGQKLGSQSAANAPALMAICIVVAQLVMVPVALLASRFAKYSRRSVFLIGFAVLPIRGWLYTMTDAPGFLIANQILDGVGAGIFGVVALLVMADLTQGTGRFNFAQGLVATAIGLGAAASNYMTGLIVDKAGFNAGFQFLSMIALVAFVLFALTFRESWRKSAAVAPVV